MISLFEERREVCFVRSAPPRCLHLRRDALHQRVVARHLLHLARRLGSRRRRPSWHARAGRRYERRCAHDEDDDAGEAHRRGRQLS